MKLITSIFFVLLFIGVQAQLKLIDPLHPGADFNNTTITVSGVPADNDLEFPLSVINTSTENYTIKCRRTEVDVLAGTTNSTCWVVCPPDVNAGDYPVMVIGQNGVEYDYSLAPGDTAIGFLAHYGPHNIDGCSLFKYEFFDAADPNTALGTVYGRFVHNVSTSCTAALTEMSKVNFSIYPNPASDQLNVEVDLKNVDVKIIDMLGKTVLTAVNVNNSTKINLMDLNNGIYFVSVLDKGTVLKTEKLIVKH
ncbi:MAG: T9SS type A sorting domain-containing protein [Flavobacteriales bacterium]|jgi:hypothetical protein|nr:T9SS type A sorting domain-containing protein [Flavobacteriales bacterium]